jgi:hypothetical protein
LRVQGEARGAVDAAPDVRLAAGEGADAQHQFGKMEWFDQVVASRSNGTIP